jgi:hypothetical protein
MDCQLNPHDAHARADSPVDNPPSTPQVAVAQRIPCATPACYRPVITGIAAGPLRRGNYQLAVS